MGNGTVLGIVGSPNRDGRTNRLVTAALEGAARMGARTELVQMADHVVSACKDCLPWVCQTNLKCTYEDPAFEYLSEKVLNCGALVIGTPVYWWDTSSMIRYFIFKMHKIYARTAPLRGLPAFGVAIAGGSGNGLISGMHPLYHFLQILQMRALEPVPATKFNFEQALKGCEERGAELAGMAHERHPFTGIEDRLLWYDSLPYLNLSLADERKLLATLTTTSLGDDADPELANGLVRAGALSAGDRHLEALKEITKVYDAGTKAFVNKPQPVKA